MMAFASSFTPSVASVRPAQRARGRSPRTPTAEMSPYAQVPSTGKDYTSGGVPASSASSPSGMSSYARVAIPNYVPSEPAIPTPASTAAAGASSAPPSDMSSYARPPSTTRDYTAGPAPSPTAPAPSGPPSTTSKVWSRTLDAVKEQISPTRVKVFFAKDAAFVAPVYAPVVQDAKPKCTRPLADAYMADCITKQYKALASSSGVYNVQCAEGTLPGQADDRRILALAADFRRRARPVAARFGDYFETRKRAVIAAHGCSYEEKLVSNYPTSAATYVLGQSEANRTCIRYAQNSSPEEEFMSYSIDMQQKMRACPNGVYTSACAEAGVKGQAETARVLALTRDFRLNQASTVEKERAKFESKKYALAQFGHGCSYEEDMFAKYPGAAASMRPSSYGY